MARHNNLRYCGHTHSIATYRLEVAILSLRLEGWSRGADIYAILQLYRLALGNGRSLGSNG